MTEEELGAKGEWANGRNGEWRRDRTRFCDDRSYVKRCTVGSVERHPHAPSALAVFLDQYLGLADSAQAKV